jgi:Lrp/AsnC family transcriptional regulator for asnA, asnC and gidA
MVAKTSRRIDDTDRAIIEQLQHDGRAPFTKLATAVGLSEAAVRQRVARLVELGAIQIVAVTNPLLIGRRRMAMIGVRTSGPTDAVSEALSAIDEVAYLVVTAGSFDLLCEVVVADDAHLLGVANTIRSLPGVVGTETFIYLALDKQTFEWGAR